MFYHTEACVIDDRCLGQFFCKSRRTGYTYEKIFRMLNEATSINNANFGITSKSDDDAKKAFKKLSYAFVNLPFFFRPVVKSKEDSDVKKRAPEKLFWGQTDWFFDGVGVGLHYRASEIIADGTQLDIYLTKQPTQQILKADVYQNMF